MASHSVPQAKNYIRKTLWRLVDKEPSQPKLHVCGDISIPSAPIAVSLSAKMTERPTLIIWTQTAP